MILIVFLCRKVNLISNHFVTDDFCRASACNAHRADIVLPNRSVRPSVCLSNAGTVSERRDMSSHFLILWYWHQFSLVFFIAPSPLQNSREHLSGSLNTTGGKVWHISPFVSETERDSAIVTIALSRLRNDLYCVEWDAKLYTIPYDRATVTMAGTLIGSHIPIGHIGSEDLEYDLEGRGGNNFFYGRAP